MLRESVTAVLLVLLLPGSAPATEPTPADVRGTVAAVIDGDTLRLADGREVRLAGILAPKPAAGDSAAAAGAARAALAGLALGHEVVVAADGRRMDRYGRALGQMMLRGGAIWLQGALLGDGLVRVSVAEAGQSRTADMLRIEAVARAGRRGLWADPAYRLRNPDDVGFVVDSFQIVEGVVLAVAERRARTYLNFGADYLTDFTVSLDGPARRLVAAAGVDLAALRGVRVRVRGWIKSFNGPMIEITHAAQIEVLE